VEGSTVRFRSAVETGPLVPVKHPEIKESFYAAKRRIVHVQISPVLRKPRVLLGKTFMSERKDKRKYKYFIKLLQAKI
jgi:hypothetical protein